MTMRRWMIAVAGVAVLIGAAMEMNGRSRRFARLAAHHSRGAMEHFSVLMGFGGGPPPSPDDLPPGARGPVRELRREQDLHLYHLALSRKYERAARYPWLPVAPDPPEPK
jgi:hypothetical protein